MISIARSAVTFFRILPRFRAWDRKVWATGLEAPFVDGLELSGQDGLKCVSWLIVSVVPRCC